MNQLTVVNNVLRRLREPTVTSVTDSTYAQLLAAFVNEGMLIVQEAHDWSTLIVDVGFSVKSNKIFYDLRLEADGGNADWGVRTPTGRSYIVNAPNNMPMIWVQDRSTDSQARPLAFADPALIDRAQWADYGRATGYLEWASIYPHEDYDGWYMVVWPYSNIVDLGAGTPYVWAKWWVPQEPLALDGSDNTTRIIARPDLVEAYAVRNALNERGEEMGEPGSIADQRFEMLLSGAVEADMMARQRTNRYEMRPD